MPHKDLEARRKYHREYQRKRRLDPEYREAQLQKTKEWMDGQKFWIRKYSKGYWRKIPTDHKQEILKRARERYKEKRRKVIEYYGNKCECCGEIAYEFLAINHINGGGSKERKRKGQRKMVQLIITNNFPKDLYNILCHNCNSSLGFYGYCPHKKIN